VATIAQDECLKLQGQESADLAAAIEEIQKYRPAVRVAPETLAWINLSVVAVGIGGRMVMDYRRTHPKRARVLQMTGRPGVAEPPATSRAMPTLDVMMPAPGPSSGGESNQSSPSAMFPFAPMPGGEDDAE